MPNLVDLKMYKELKKKTISEIVAAFDTYPDTTAEANGRIIDITVGNTRYRVWPYGQQWEIIGDNGDHSLHYHGSLEWFIARYITKEEVVPKNAGRVWSEEDNDYLQLMIRDNLTIQTMADRLNSRP